LKSHHEFVSALAREMVFPSRPYAIVMKIDLQEGSRETGNCI
jgi:hypothetical protein